MSVVEGLKIQIHVCGTYVLSVWFTLLIGFGSVWIFSRHLLMSLIVVTYGCHLYMIVTYSRRLQICLLLIVKVHSSEQVELIFYCF